MLSLDSSKITSLLFVLPLCSLVLLLNPSSFLLSRSRYFASATLHKKPIMTSSTTRCFIFCPFSFNFSVHIHKIIISDLSSSLRILFLFLFSFCKAGTAGYLILYDLPASRYFSSIMENKNSPLSALVMQKQII